MGFVLRVFSLVISIFCFSATLVSAQKTFVEPGSKKSFPAEVSFSFDGTDYTLIATGASELKRTREDKSQSLFTLAHYIQTPPTGSALTIYDAILKSNSAKQVTMSFNDDIEAEKFGRIFARWFQRVGTTAELQKVKKSYDTLIEAISGAIKENDQYTFRWLSPGKLIVAVPGKPVKVINDAAFAQLFWKVWLGELSPLKRVDLVRLITS
ncbi:MAG: chalcone isomerase family protein [candidate division KSB1 bacterium]|nr:chalcone isomerase family protein [candidate division KSB1 bacterium]